MNNQEVDFYNDRVQELTTTLRDKIRGTYKEATSSGDPDREQRLFRVRVQNIVRSSSGDSGGFPNIIVDIEYVRPGDRRLDSTYFKDWRHTWANHKSTTDLVRDICGLAAGAGFKLIQDSDSLSRNEFYYQLVFLNKEANMLFTVQELPPDGRASNRCYAANAWACSAN